MGTTQMGRNFRALEGFRIALQIHLKAEHCTPVHPQVSASLCVSLQAALNPHKARCRCHYGNNVTGLYWSTFSILILTHSNVHGISTQIFFLVGYHLPHLPVRFKTSFWIDRGGSSSIIPPAYIFTGNGKTNICHENFLDHEDFWFLMVVVIFRKASYRSPPCPSVCKAQEIFSTLVKKKNNIYLIIIFILSTSCGNVEYQWS